jgi:hypothetical protein
VPFAPLYQLASIELLSINMIAVLQRDQVEALAAINPALQPFVYFGTARRVDQIIFPACFALPVRIPMTQDADLQGVTMRQELQIEVANISADPEALAREMLQRTRACVQIALSAAGADLFEGVTLSNYGGLAWDVTEIQINQWPRQNAQGHYFSSAQSSITFNYVER